MKTNVIKKFILIPAIIFPILMSVMNKLPKVFLIGDSISVFYTPYLTKDLAKISYNLERKSDNDEALKNLDVPAGSNSGDSRRVLWFLHNKLKNENFKPDLVLLNCGLHDIKRYPETHTIQVDSAEYRKNLEEIYALLEARKIPIIWINTTPVDDERHNSRTKTFKRYDKDVQDYNAIASEVFMRHQVPIIDLYHFTKNLPGTYIDHVHYDETTREKQAGFISAFVAKSKK
jgi:hypothetical protein